MTESSYISYYITNYIHLTTLNTRIFEYVYMKMVLCCLHISRFLVCPFMIDFCIPAYQKTTSPVIIYGKAHMSLLTKSS